MDRLTKRDIDGCPFLAKDEGYLKLLSRLAAYEDAEEQGLLIKLPCKVGLNVYKLVDKCHPRNMECPFEGGYGIGRCHKEKDRYKFCGAYIEEVKFEIAMIAELYKSIFIDRKEAEDALAKYTNVSSKRENNG